MAKKVRLQLDDLSVKSFVTSLEDDEKKGAKGGDYSDDPLWCSTQCSIYPPPWTDIPFDCTLECTVVPKHC
jgi:hypothetical protein